MMKVKAMCDEGNSATMQKMCLWMQKNREVALGMLISKVEPWKFAKGWCMHFTRMHDERGWHRRHHWGHEPRDFGEWGKGKGKKGRGKGKGKWHHPPFGPGPLDGSFGK